MNFEYNGNLKEEERISLVAREIVDKYSQISLEKAKEAALLEGRISTPKTYNDELNRLYNIMLVNSDNKNSILDVYRDFLNVLSKNQNEDIDNYLTIAYEIDDYLDGKADFPFLSDVQ